MYFAKLTDVCSVLRTSKPIADCTLFRNEPIFFVFCNLFKIFSLFLKISPVLTFTSGSLIGTLRAHGYVMAQDRYLLLLRDLGPPDHYSTVLSPIILEGIRSAPVAKDSMTSLLVIFSAQPSTTTYAKNLQCRSTRLILLTPLRMDYTRGQKCLYMTIKKNPLWKIFEEEL